MRTLGNVSVGLVHHCVNSAMGMGMSLFGADLAFMSLGINDLCTQLLDHVFFKNNAAVPDSIHLSSCDSNSFVYLSGMEVVGCDPPL